MPSSSTSYEVYGRLYYYEPLQNDRQTTFRVQILLTFTFRGTQASWLEPRTNSKLFTKTIHNRLKCLPIFKPTRLEICASFSKVNHEGLSFFLSPNGISAVGSSIVAEQARPGAGSGDGVASACNRRTG